MPAIDAWRWLVEPARRRIRVARASPPRQNETLALDPLSADVLIRA